MIDNFDKFRTLILILFLFLISTVDGWAMPVIPEGSANETGIIELHGTPGARVAIDEIFINSIPETETLIIHNVRAGSRTVSISMDGYQSEIQIVPVYVNDSTYVETSFFVPYGGLIISSTPSDAEVYVNGIRFGNTPVEAYQMDLGNYSIILKKEGYNDWEGGARVLWNENTTVDVNLESFYPVSPVKTSQSPGFVFITVIFAMTIMIVSQYGRKKVSDQK